MIRIGTRGSRLALWQANHLKGKLMDLGIDSELVIIKTKGDQVQHLGFDKMEGKGFFTKEIEEALFSKNVDIAVHSMKDLPTAGIEGLTIGGLSERADPSDLLIIRKDRVDPSRKIKVVSGAKIGTSSIRRKVQIIQFDPHFELADIRGNVPTRVDKLRAGQFDAIILASAGINRLDLDLSDFETVRFSPLEFVTAPGQGVIAYQSRSEDLDTRRILKSIHNSATALQTNVERKVLQLMDGGCQLPLGVYCYVDRNRNFHSHSMYAEGLGEKVIRVNYSQNTSSGLAEKIVEGLMAGRSKFIN